MFGISGILRSVRIRLETRYFIKINVEGFIRSVSLFIDFIF